MILYRNIILLCLSLIFWFSISMLSSYLYSNKILEIKGLEKEHKIANEKFITADILSKKLNSDYLLNSFNDLRENSIKNIINYSGFDTLPITKIDKSNFDPKSYFEENISIKEIDYYFTNSIARSSKTMSDCRSARSENLTSKTGT